MCDRVRESVSAVLDGEQGVLPDEVVEDHLAVCSSCTTWRSDVESMTRRVRVGVAPVLTDETDRYVAAVLDDSMRRTHDRRRLQLVRVALVAVAIGQLVLAAPILLLGHDQLAPEHVAHELGAFSVALAVGLLLAAFRPRLSTGMVPIVGIVALLLVVTAWIDAVLRYTQLTQEWPHLLEVAGFLLLLRLTYLTNERDWTPLLLPLRRHQQLPRPPFSSAPAPSAAPGEPAARNPEPRRATGT